MWKKIGLGFLILVILVLVEFVFELGGLQWKKFFAPKHANVERKVFEEQKSYVHGMTRDLAKYYEEYYAAESVADKQAIENLIKMNFADFDETNIRNENLYNFLITTRGY